jgi:hypothetical protein
MSNIIFSEGSGLNNALYGNWQAPLQAVIMKRAEAFEQLSLFKKIYTQVKSTHFGESYTGMTSMEGFRPGGENSEPPIDGFQQTYDKLLKNVRWQDSFAISREMSRTPDREHEIQAGGVRGELLPHAGGVCGGPSGDAPGRDLHHLHIPRVGVRLHRGGRAAPV